MNSNKQNNRLVECAKWFNTAAPVSKVGYLATIACTAIFTTVVHMNEPEEETEPPLNVNLGRYSFDIPADQHTNILNSLLGESGAFDRLSDFRVTGDTYEAVLQSALIHNIPPNTMLAMCAKESGCNPKITNNIGACGIFQIMTNKTATLFENIYKYAADYGYYAERALVEKHTDSNYVDIYRPTKNGLQLAPEVDQNDPDVQYLIKRAKKINAAEARRLLLNACRGAELNTLLHGRRMVEDAPDLENFLGRTLEGRDLYAMSFWGPRGAQLFHKVLQASPDMPVTDFIKKYPKSFRSNLAKENESLIFKASGQSRTMAELYEHTGEFAGTERLASFKDWVLPNLEQTIVASIYPKLDEINQIEEPQEVPTNLEASSDSPMSAVLRLLNKITPTTETEEEIEKQEQQATANPTPIEQ